MAEEFDASFSQPEKIMDEGKKIFSNFNPSPKFYRTIALTFLGAAFLLVIGVFYFTLGKAEINLVLKPKNVKVDTLLNVATKATEKNQIEGLILSTTLKAEKEFNISGGGQAAPSMATGQVIIYNKTQKNQPLVATTRLLTPNNILFRLKKTVLVPAGGQMEAEVYADQLGESGNIGPTRFAIPGLSESLQKVIYAESAKAFNGGIKYTKILTEADVKNAGEILINDLTQRGQEQLKKMVSATSSFSSSLFTFSAEPAKTGVKIGEEVDSFKMTEEVKIIGVFYDPAAVKKLISEQLKTLLHDNEIVVGEVSSPIMELGKYDLGAKTTELKATQNFAVQVNYLEDVIDKSKILGQKKAAVKEYLENLPWIERAEIRTSPGWLKKIPGEAGKVKIKIVQ